MTASANLSKQSLIAFLIYDMARASLKLQRDENPLKDP